MVEKIPVKMSKEDSASRNTQSVIAHALIALLSAECKVYCILTGYDQLPDSFDSDIDFMVDANDFERMPALIQDLAKRTNTRLFRATEHEMSARAYLLVAQSDSNLTFVSPDCTSDYRHYGLLWLHADEVLANRRWHPNGFWIPSPSHEFIYYLIKRMNKRDFTSEQGLRLHRLYTEDPQRADQMLARYWSGHHKETLRSMAASGDWDALLPNLASFRDELMRHSIESPIEKLGSLRRRVHHFMDRVLRPTGGWIAFMGPDGCGKSSVIEAITAEFAPAFREVDRFHMHPKFLRRSTGGKALVTDPHGLPPRSLLTSIAKVFYYVADYLLGYWLRIRPAIIRTKLVVFDRYFYDLLVDHKRVRYGGPAWMLTLAGKLVPRPELVILLNAPAEVLWSRKQEVPFEEVVRQQKNYCELAERLQSTVIIDASQPLPDVILQTAEAIIAHFAQRTAVRLGLDSQTSSLDLVGASKK